MNEISQAQWLEFQDPKRLMSCLGDGVSERKLRLLLCAGCRAVPDLVGIEFLQNALVDGERYADGESPKAGLVHGLWHRSGWTEQASWLKDSSRNGWAVNSVGRATYSFNLAPDAAMAGMNLLVALQPDLKGFYCDLVREVFGNYFFRSTVRALDPSWLTPTVVSLSQAAYQERELSSGQLDCMRMAVLADALEEAGCCEYWILSHLRYPGYHVRGCWVLDVLLGKG